VLLLLLQEFLGWCDRLFGYLQVLENRLFSEGLHVLGAPPSDAQMAQYLEVRGCLLGWGVEDDYYCSRALLC
jgi:hypothetical protein